MNQQRIRSESRFYLTFPSWFATYGYMIKRTKWILGITSPIAIILILLYVVPFFIPWSELHCWSNYIDINSGQTKYEKYMLYIKVVERTSETEISRLYRKLIGEPPPPDWRITCTLSPGVGNSPHYAYHGTEYVLYKLELSYNYENFTDEAKKETILTILKLLKEDQCHYLAEKYSDSVGILAFAKSKQQPGYKITVADLPETPEQK